VELIKQIIKRWWSEFTLQTKLMVTATLAVSLLMSSLTFWAVNSIQEEAYKNDTRFGQDLGLLLASNVAPLLAEDNLTEVAKFSNRFYHNTSSVTYMIYADVEGNIFFGIPFSQKEVKNSLTLQRHIQLPENYKKNTDTPLVRQHLTPNGQITDVFIPLNYEGKYFGVLAIGINPNPTVVASSNLTRDVTIAVFISIWAMVILGGVLNALTITQPIKELLLGVKNIAAGNFQQRINLPLEGELGELILSFNEMAEKLKKYEEQNIEELTAEKAKLETLVSTIADGAILLDSDLQLILVNPTAQRMFSWEGRNIIGENILEYLPSELKLELNKPLTKIASGEIINPEQDKNYSEILAHRGEFRITVNNPTPHTFRILLTQVLNQQKENVKGIVMTVQDITRETELNEAKSQFISNVSHELRTPLFNIKSFIETLFEYGDDLTETEKLEFLETANNETDRLTRLVNDVLDLTRLESGLQMIEFKPIDLPQLIDQTFRTYQLNARDKKIQLIQEIEPNLPLVLGHYDLLLQVLTNLIGNSLKFTLEKGKIAIRAYTVKNNPKSPAKISHVRIEISDTGIGIPQEDQPEIFDRFFRVENRVHTLEGTGLGLSIVKNIIEEKHHTQINLISEVDVGTTFWFDLTIYEQLDTQINDHQMLVATH
jgi:two-component system sensor histidine kinase NblS